METTSWGIIGWIVLGVLGLFLLRVTLVLLLNLLSILVRWWERRTPEGRRAQACRDRALIHRTDRGLR